MIFSPFDSTKRSNAYLNFSFIKKPFKNADLNDIDQSFLQKDLEKYLGDFLSKG